MRALRKQLPAEEFIYVGDTARAPFGDRSPAELLAIGRELIGFLRMQNVKAIVLACGTLSSTAYKTLCQDFADLQIIDVLRPGIAAVRESQAACAGILATSASVNNGTLERMLRSACPDMQIHTRACPAFAPLAERGIFDDEAVHQAAREYLLPLRGKIDALVLACTHYPLLAPALCAVLPDVQMIDLSNAVAAAAQSIPSAPSGVPSPPVYYVSGVPARFNAIASVIMQENCTTFPLP